MFWCPVPRLREPAGTICWSREEVHEDRDPSDRGCQIAAVPRVANLWARRACMVCASTV